MYSFLTAATDEKGGPQRSFINSWVSGTASISLDAVSRQYSDSLEKNLIARERFPLDKMITRSSHHDNTAGNSSPQYWEQIYMHPMIDRCHIIAGYISVELATCATCYKETIQGPSFTLCVCGGDGKLKSMKIVVHFTH